MTAEGDYWSIDFFGTDERKAQAVVDKAKELGLAAGGIIADPEAFLTLHLDLCTVEALNTALTHSQASQEVLAGVSSVRTTLTEWRLARERQE